MKFLGNKQIVYTKEEFEKNVKNHIPCKCGICGEEPAIYRRRLSLNMIRVMVYLNTFDPLSKGIHIQKELAKISIVAPAMDYIQLKRWGFIASLVEVEDNQTVIKTGFYYLTATGKDFLNNKYAVREEVLIYKNKTLLFEGALVYCKDIVTNSKIKFIDILKEWKI